MCSMVLVPDGESVNYSLHALYIVSPDLSDPDAGSAALAIGSANNARRKLKPGVYWLFVMSGNCTWSATIEQQLNSFSTKRVAA